jgi:hypothetical protein
VAVTVAKPYGVLTKKLVIATAVGGVVLVAGLSTVVGIFASDVKGFDWTLASVFGTALGTTLLAMFTGALAYTTSGDVRATYELAALTRAEQEMRDMPIVVVENVTWRLESGRTDHGELKGRLAVRCRNVGLGPALRLRVDAVIDNAVFGVTESVTTQGTKATVMPGEIVAFVLPIEFGTVPTKPPTSSDFPLKGVYRGRDQKKEYPLIVELQDADQPAGVGVTTEP